MSAISVGITPNNAETRLVEAAPDAQIWIYPDSAHGFLFQYPIEVAAEVNAFLD